VFSLFAIFDGDRGGSPSWTFPGALVSAADGAAPRSELRRVACNVSGQWQYDSQPRAFELTFIEPAGSSGNFTFKSTDPATPWRMATGRVNVWGQVTIYYDNSITRFNAQINTACNTIESNNPYFIFRRGYRPPPPPGPPPPPPPPPLPTAHFALRRGRNTTIRAALVLGFNTSHCAEQLAKLALARHGSFEASWEAAAARWEARWQNAFDPTGSADYSGSLPVLTVAKPAGQEATVAPLERAYYMGVLTLLLCQRNHFSMSADPRFAQPRVYTTGMGNDVGDGVAVGLTQRWFWDSAQHALTSSLLDPAMYAADAAQILTFDFHLGNGLDLYDWRAPPRTASNGSEYAPPKAMQGYGFNAWSYFNTVSMVQRVTNGSVGASANFLHAPIQTFAGERSISEILEVTAAEGGKVILVRPCAFH
jgi:hypothetical protein